MSRISRHGPAEQDSCARPPLRRSQTTWTDANGTKHAAKMASYSGPGFSFASFAAMSESLVDSSTEAPGRFSHAPSTGLFGTAFGLLGEVLSSKLEDKVRRESTSPSRISKGRNTTPPRRPSHRPRFDRGSSFNSEPARGNKCDSRRPSYASDLVDIDKDDDFTRGQDYGIRQERSSRKTRKTIDPVVLAELEDDVDRCDAAAARSRKRLKTASRQAYSNAAMLEAMLDEVKGRERAYESALRRWEAARSCRRHDSKHEARPPRAAPSERRRSPLPRRDHYEDDYESGSDNASFHKSSDDFFDKYSKTPQGAMRNDFDYFSHNAPRHPNLHEDLHRLFAEFAATSSFNSFCFPSPGAQSSARPQPHKRFSSVNAGPQYRASPHSHPTYPAPPPTYLHPSEAQRLFQTYNTHWLSLPASSPAIPYPTRTLQRNLFSDPATLWSPFTTAIPSAWSNETVMQANAQAFFLGAVGLVPTYTENPATGKILMGFDKKLAKGEVVSRLVEVLKREKVRWHSDRLGRRNGGLSGIGAEVNEGLQREEGARAVFHAVCELMEFAQG